MVTESIILSLLKFTNVRSNEIFNCFSASRDAVLSYVVVSLKTIEYEYGSSELVRARSLLHKSRWTVNKSILLFETKIGYWRRNNLDAEHNTLETPFDLIFGRFITWPTRYTIRSNTVSETQFRNWYIFSAVVTATSFDFFSMRHHRSKYTRYRHWPIQNIVRAVERKRKTFSREKCATTASTRINFCFY